MGDINARLNEIPSPNSIPTKYHVWANDKILLTNFEAGKSNTLGPHKTFVDSAYIPWLIKQIDAFADPNMKTLTFHIFGFASATGKKDKNQKLSEDRAAATGELLKKSFDAAKARSRYAAGISVNYDVKGEGDTAARAALDDALKKAHLRREQVSDNVVEDLQFGSRGSLFSTVLRPNLTDDYFTYQARQIYVFGLKKQKVPASQLEAWIDETKRDFENAAGKEVVALLGLSLDLLKMGAKDLIKELLSDVPLLFLLEDLIEFIWISDVASCFEFKDHRSQTAIYNYYGDENKLTYSLLKAVSRVLSLIKTLGALSNKLEALAKSGKFKGFTAIVKKIENMRKIGVKIAEILVGATSPLRRVLGDSAVDFLRDSILDAAPASDIAIAPVSPWSLFRFRDPKFYDVRSFGSFARTLNKEYLYQSELTLDFGAERDLGSTAYKASVLIISGTSARNNLIGIGVSHGRMTLRP